MLIHSFPLLIKLTLFSLIDFLHSFVGRMQIRNVDLVPLNTHPNGEPEREIVENVRLALYGEHLFQLVRIVCRGILSGRSQAYLVCC